MLGGMVVGAWFQALISVTQYLADPVNNLLEITFWLFGGRGRMALGGLTLPAVIVAACLGVLFMARDRGLFR